MNPMRDAVQRALLEAEHEVGRLAAELHLPKIGSETHDRGDLRLALGRARREVDRCRALLEAGLDSSVTP